jgi:hypothetical protein
MRRFGLLASGALFLGALGYSWLTHGTGVIRNDPERNVSVPSALTVLLRVQVAHNGTDVLFRYRWPSPNPGIHHDMLRFDGAAWQVRGRAAPGPAGDGLHEDRVAICWTTAACPNLAAMEAVAQ